MKRRKKRNSIDATGRTKGSERFVQIPHYMLNCPAWASLSGNTTKVFVDLLKRFNGYNNGVIHDGVREAAKIGIGKNICARALQKLEQKGFIRCIRDPSFDLKTRESREWAITDRKFGDNLPTKDFMKWGCENLNHGPTSGTVRNKITQKSP